MIKYIFLILLVSINHCSFNSNSKFWTKEKKVEQLSKNVKKIFEDEKVISKELNENIKARMMEIGQQVYSQSADGDTVNNTSGDDVIETDFSTEK